MNSLNEQFVESCTAMLPSTSRRSFLKWMSLSGAVLMAPPLLAGCSDDEITDPSLSAMFNLDAPIGPINVVYANVLLLAEFYARVRALHASYPGMTLWEQNTFSGYWRSKGELAEVIRMLYPTGMIPETLYFNFHNLNFASQTAVLDFAVVFEDLGLELAHAAASRVKDPNDLTLLGKVASISAREATTIRSINSIVRHRQSLAMAINAEVIAPSTGANLSSDLTAGITLMQPYFETKLTVK